MSDHSFSRMISSYDFTVEAIISFSYCYFLLDKKLDGISNEIETLTTNARANVSARRAENSRGRVAAFNFVSAFSPAFLAPTFTRGSSTNGFHQRKQSSRPRKHENPSCERNIREVSLVASSGEYRSREIRCARNTFAECRQKGFLICRSKEETCSTNKRFLKRFRRPTARNVVKERKLREKLLFGSRRSERRPP